jgi:hypothetical protein
MAEERYEIARPNGGIRAMSDEPKAPAAERIEALRSGLIEEIRRREREIDAIRSKLRGIDMAIAAISEEEND